MIDIQAAVDRATGPRRADDRETRPRLREADLRLLARIYGVRVTGSGGRSRMWLKNKTTVKP